jgi:predicted acyl esterase
MEEEPIHYFVMGEEVWKSADSWPPRTNALTFFIESGSVLTEKVNNN